MNESKKEPKVDLNLNLLGVLLLYLIAVLAGAVNTFVGIAAFVCITIFLLGIVYLSMRSESEETT